MAFLPPIIRMKVPVYVLQLLFYETSFLRMYIQRMLIKPFSVLCQHLPELIKTCISGFKNFYLVSIIIIVAVLMNKPNVFLLIFYSVKTSATCFRTDIKIQFTFHDKNLNNKRSNYFVMAFDT